MRYIHEGYLSLKDASDKQSNFAAELKNLDKHKKKTEKRLFLNNFGLFFSAIEKVLINSKSRLLPKKIDKIQTRKPTPELATEPTKRNKKS